ncbi:replication initiation protein, partial [Salmonella enterica subsp. enterica serovar Heidelberg]|nr:replication initiation protein [Salmonella enterica subsp. enterica serovar Heidelberg]EFC6685230.1 replication initiation protein [Escherichia coli]EFP9479312.1 replication initiation protein [Shigella sonnei]EGE3589424.1 replication initiation protein [Shigella flexneri]EFQ0082346.1 replication initiation protein [Shigella sonnei]
PLAAAIGNWTRWIEILRVLEVVA